MSVNYTSSRLSGSFYTPEEMADYLIAEGSHYCSEPGTIIDMACGDGALLVAATKRFPNVPLLGVDTHPTALEQAAKRLQTSPATFYCGDALVGEPWGPKRSRVSGVSSLDWSTVPLNPPLWFVCNPPFMGKNTALESYGSDYWRYLKDLHSAHGNSDICAHFLRRAASVAERGLLSFICTNTISQGDTRKSGLQPLVAQGWEIVCADTNIPWPGEAAVTVSLIHLVRE